MKIRESGMPDAAIWDTFFDPDVVLKKSGLTSDCPNLVEFGCGYGTFTLPAARLIHGLVHSFDIDKAMTSRVERSAKQQGINNIRCVARDFISDGTGLDNASMDHAMVFNILHNEDPSSLLREAHRVLKTAGTLGVIHWIPDPSTPRGPPMEIRPSPDQCIQWAADVGFSLLGNVIALPPYHYGLRFSKQEIS